MPRSVIDSSCRCLQHHCIMCCSDASQNEFTQLELVPRLREIYDRFVQDTVLVIYTVGYPPRLVPVSLVLPGLDVKSSSVFANVPDTAPAPAPAVPAKAPAVLPAVSAPAGSARAPASNADLAGRVIAVNRTAHPPTASFQSKALKV